MSPRRSLALTAAASALLVAAPALGDVPQILPTLSGQQGAHGWYTGPVTVSWSVTHADTSMGCDIRTIKVDTTGTPITCTAWSGLIETSVTVPVKVDQTAPTGVAAAAARGPDAGSWFTSPVAISWSGDDATSGVESCTSLTYGGPDGAAAAPTGTCRDVAGNISAPMPFTLDYDATPPALADVSATAAAGRADLHYAVSPDTVRVTVVRDGAPPTTVADGPPGTGVSDTGLAPATTYSWAVTAVDQAGNAATQRATATTPAATLRSVKPGAVQLRWHKVRGATYYNVQIFRGARKVLSAWPRHPRFAIAPTWRFRGRTHHLVPGKTYRWFAWAGFGRRSAHRYGRLLAHGHFKVPG